MQASKATSVRSNSKCEKPTVPGGFFIFIPTFITSVYRRELIAVSDHCYIGQEIKPGLMGN